MPVASVPPSSVCCGWIAPGDERREAARLVLKVAQPEQVLEPLLHRLDRAVHHRRRRAQPGAMRVPHDVEPLVGGRLVVAVEDAGGRDRRESPRRRRECCRDRPRSSRSITSGTGSCDSREMWMTSGGDSACSRKSGYRCFTCRNRSSYHAQRHVRVVAALQQQLAAAERDRLFDLPEDLVEPERVALRRSDGPIERAELAARDADVRVVDVAVDDVGDDAVRDASRGRTSSARRPSRAVGASV